MLTFKEFSQLARKRNHTAESLAALFRGKIDQPRDFFERVMSCRLKDCSDLPIPYRSVIEFYQRAGYQIQSELDRDGWRFARMEKVLG